MIHVIVLIDQSFLDFALKFIAISICGTDGYNF